MKKSRALAMVRVMAMVWLAGAAWAAGAEPITLSSLLKEMTQRENLARWPSPAYTLKQASSYDRASTNPAVPQTWFANDDHDQFIRIEENEGRREWVIMDHTGPGAITRAWLPLEPSRDGQIIRFYFDGAPTPAISAGFNELMSGQAFVRPPFAFVAWNETDLRHQVGSKPPVIRGVAGDLYLPIPFAKGCKVTLDKVPFYYIINYRAYEPGTAVETLSLANYQAARPAVEQAARELLSEPPTEAREPGRRATLAPGEEIRISLPAGPAAVRLLQVKVDPKDAPQALRSVVLHAEFDGEPAVWCPLGSFFGSGTRLNPVQDWYRTTKADGGLSARWVMPYQHSGSLAVKNLGTTPTPLSLASDTTPWVWDDRSLLFKANWRCQNELKTRPMTDWNYIEIQGQGLYAGDTLTVFSPVSAWYGEGDERVYFEGETLPSHNGTGTEDYYGYAWGMAGFFSSPFLSAPRRDVMSRDNWRGYTTTSRLRLLDGMPFRKGFRFDMEIWNWADTQVDYAAGTFWYARPGATHNRAPQPAEAGQALRLFPAARVLPDVVECETMAVLKTSKDLKFGTQSGYPFTEGAWSGETQLFVQATRPGEFIELLVAENVTGPRKLLLHGTTSYDYGVVRFSVNGQAAGGDFDGYSAKPEVRGPIALGVFPPQEGRLVLRVEVVGANPAASGPRHYFGLDAVQVQTP